MFTKKGAIVKIILEILSHREKLSINLQVTQSLICSFDETKNRHKFYRRKDCIKRFCNDLKELATEIINYEEKEMTLLKDTEITLHESQKVCHICKEKFCNDINKKSKYAYYHKVRDHCHYTGKFRGAAHNIWNLR